MLFIIGLAGLASHRRSQLSSNVRRRRKPAPSLVRPLCYIPYDPSQAFALRRELERNGIRVHETEASFLERGRYWVDESLLCEAQVIARQMSASTAPRTTRRKTGTARSRWKDGSAWIALLALLLVLFVYLGLPALAALGF